MGVSRLTERLAPARTVWAMLRPSECAAVPNAPSSVMSSPCAAPRFSLNLTVPPTPSGADHSSATGSVT